MIKNKIISRSKIAKLLKRIRKGKQVVFTNGCFDILHKGHVKYLEDAKALGDILVVAINSDSSVKKIKGPKRPLNKVDDRAYLVGALESVDFVTIFNETTPLETMKIVRPDVIVKGADWKIDNIVGKDLVESYGGKVRTIKFIKNYSTTSLIDKILDLK